jgi:Flp pilus assembly protein TadG
MNLLKKIGAALGGSAARPRLARDVRGNAAVEMALVSAPLFLFGIISTGQAM